MNENFYRRMMNRGFLIFEGGGKFMLAKVPTPADPRPSIFDAQSNTSEIEFNSWEEAISKAEFLCQKNFCGAFLLPTQPNLSNKSER